MDPELQALLSGGGGDAPKSHDIEMPVQRVEGDPEAGMSGVEKLGKRLLSAIRGTPMMGDMLASKAGQAMTGGVNHGLSAGVLQDLPGDAGAAARGWRDSAQAANPALYSAGDVAGSLAMPVPGGASESVPGAIFKGGAVAGATGTARDFSDANPDEDLTTRAMGALAQGGKAAGAGAATAGGLAGLGALARPLDAGSDAARRVAVAGLGSKGKLGELVDEMGTRKGLDYVADEVPKLPEKLGLTNWIIPKSSVSYAKGAAGIAEDVEGPRIGDSLNKAAWEIGSPRPVPAGEPLSTPFVDKSRIEDKLGALGKEASSAPQLTGGDASNYAELQGRLRNQDIQTPQQLHALKTAYENGAVAPGATAYSPESSIAKANAGAANATRAHLDSVMKRADPSTYAQFKDANQRFGDAKLIENLARHPALRDLAAPAGGALAGAGYEAYHSHMDPASMAEGAAAGALAGHYGADLTANALRGASQGAGGLTALSQTALPGKLAGALTPGDSHAGAQDAVSQMGRELSTKQLNEETRGPLIPQAIQHALRSNQLGPYSNDFAKAAMSSEPNALGALYESLSRTDPTFAEQYKPLIQQLTAEDR